MDKLLKFCATIFIPAAVILFILYMVILNDDISDVYAAQSNRDSRLTIIESGTVPSNAGMRDWEYTIYSIRLDNGDTKCYIEYYNSHNRDVELEEISFK